MNADIAVLLHERNTLKQKLRATALYYSQHGQPFACGGRGCWGCCRGEVAVLPQEVPVLAQALNGHRAEVEPLVRQLVQRVLAVPGEAGLEILRTARCPLLAADGACLVYEERPLICRGYCVVTPREWCYQETAGVQLVATPGEVLQATFAAMAAVDSEVLQAPDRLQPLPLALLDWWGKEDSRE